MMAMTTRRLLRRRLRRLHCGLSVLERKNVCASAATGPTATVCHESGRGVYHARFRKTLLRTNLARTHAANHVLHHRDGSNDECHDRERSGGGTKLNRKAGRIGTNNNVCLPDANKRSESDEDEKDAEAPLRYKAASGTSVSLLFTHESHNKKGRRGK